MNKVNREALNKVTKALREIPEELHIKGSYYTETWVDQGGVRPTCKAGACALGHIIEILYGERDNLLESQAISMIQPDYHRGQDPKRFLEGWTGTESAIITWNDIDNLTLAQIAVKLEQRYANWEDA